MLFSSIVIHFAFLCFVDLTRGLERLPRAIASTETVRHVVNELFSSLKIKVDKNSTRKIKEYSKIHKYFVRLTRLENNDSKELLKVTSPDIKIDNGIVDFTTVINEVLNEDNKTEAVSDTLNEENVNRHIENFLGTLEKFKELYLQNNSYIAINNDVLQQFHRTHGNNSKIFALNPTESDENEVWIPNKTRRIYQGKRTKIRDFPFVASVQLFNSFTCAGSVIERDLVITAASCLQLVHNNRFYRENPSFLSVRVGSSFFNGAGEVIPVIEVYFHPSYEPKSLYNNLAIMRLNRQINLQKTNSVKKIILDTNAWNLPPNTPGITILGWGAKTKTNKMINPWENKLSYAELDFYPLEDCQDVYSRKFVTKKNFCAGFMSHGGGACNRDIGAPGVIHGVLTGVVSFGSSSCGLADAPTVFTKLGYYTDWIEEIMEQQPNMYSVKPTTPLPAFIHTIMITRPHREMNFLIEPLDTIKLKSIKEMDLRTRNSKGNADVLRDSQSDKNNPGDDEETSISKEEIKDANKKNKKSKKNKGLATARKDDSTASESYFEPLKSFVTENIDILEKSSSETDKTVNNDINLLVTNIDEIMNVISTTAQTPGSDESKEKATLPKQKEDTNIDKDDTFSSETDKEWAALQLIQGINSTSELKVTKKPTKTVNSEHLSSKEIAQAFEILSKVVNRPKSNTSFNVPLHQQSAKSFNDQELEIEKQIDDLFEKNVEEHRQEAQMVNSYDEDGLKLLEKKPEATDDNILRLFYLVDSERNNTVNTAYDTNQRIQREGIEVGNVTTVTYQGDVVDETLKAMFKDDVYDILTEVMGME